MIEPTVDHPPGRPETTMQPVYLGYLIQAAVEFGNDLGISRHSVDLQKMNAMADLFLSPVDSLE